MFLHGQTTGLEKLGVMAELAWSSSARQTHRRFATVSLLLRSALADDDTIVVNVQERKPLSRPARNSWLLLIALSIVIFFEYRSYTIPALSAFVRETAHRCGL
jgi:hypothetical protein